MQNKNGSQGEGSEQQQQYFVSKYEMEQFYILISKCRKSNENGELVSKDAEIVFENSRNI